MADLPLGFPPATPEGKIEIKTYPAYRSITYEHHGNLPRASQAAFNALYRHISSNQISMTTPVEVRYPDHAATATITPTNLADTGTAKVSFIYPQPDITPQQVGNDVCVTDHPAITVASIGIRGAYTWESYQQHWQQLQSWLQQHPEYEIVGSPRRFLYNSPYTPVEKKMSEVQIPIQKKE